MATRKIGIIILFLVLILINTASGQIENIEEHFSKKFKQLLSKRGDCNVGLVLLEPITKFLGIYRMEGWIEVLYNNRITKVIPRDPFDEKVLCIKTNFIQNHQNLFVSQAAILDKLVLYFEWARNILEGTRYSFIDRIITKFYGDPYMSEPAEALLKSTPPCISILRNFVNRQPVDANLVDNEKGLLQDLFERGIASGAVIRNATSYSFQDATISRMVGGDEKFQALKSDTKKFITQFNSFSTSIGEASKTFFEAYKQISAQEELNNFAKSVDKFVNENATTARLYLTSNQQESTCLLLLNVILTGKTPTGRDASNFSQNILKPQMEMVSSTMKEINKIITFLNIAIIKAERQEIPLAVIPPIVFSDEHRGAESFKQITPERIFNEVRDFIFNLSPIIFILLLIIGAIFYILSPIKIEYLKIGSEYIKWAVIGYFVLLVISAIFMALRIIFGGP
ncbi:MAG: hypothetical protein KatS3mg094_558 [Candidatus Parcubacteria bacterium]|nr:MAG: hypothetical protein KatS3mg094_558 [Candidatus Parcubacteria bacterium]